MRIPGGPKRMNEEKMDFEFANLLDISTFHERDYYSFIFMFTFILN